MSSTRDREGRRDSIPIGSTAKKDATRPSQSSDAPPVDIHQFSTPDFLPQKYVHSVLTNLSTEDAVRTFHTSLSLTRDAAARDLQRNVYKNYPDFVRISKEIGKLESDLLLLRGLMGEVRNVVGGLCGEKEDALVVENVLVEREDSELGDGGMGGGGGLVKQGEEETRRAQMKRLYGAVEGLTKVLPPWPDRYILRDTSVGSQFWEVHATTYKPLVPVTLYLLVDTLLVTTKKKNLISSKKASREVIERCWSLNDVAIIDMKDSIDVTNAFKVMRHPDTVVYRSESGDGKRGFLAAFKRWVEEKGQKKEVRMETGKIPESPTKSDIPALPALPTKRKQTDTLTPAEASYLLSLADDLDVLIAHRDFEQAVSLLTKARTILAPLATQDSPRLKQIRSMLESRKQTLAKLVSLDLANPVASKVQVQSHIGKLLRLGLGSAARDFFLSARTEVLRHKIRSLKIDGDIPSYIHALAATVFRLLRNTAEWYDASFADDTMSAGFIQWVRRELEYFALIVRKQVFSDAGPSWEEVVECLGHVVESSQQLRDVGLEMGFLMEELFEGDVRAAMEAYANMSRELVLKALRKDTFSTVAVMSKQINAESDPAISDVLTPVSPSVAECVNLLNSFLETLQAIVSLPLYPPTVLVIQSIFTTYANSLTDLVREMPSNTIEPGASAATNTKATVYTTYQRSIQLVNLTTLVTDILPKTNGALTRLFQRPILELDHLHSHLQTMLDTLTNALISRELSHLHQYYDFSKIDYTSNGGILDSAKPSAEIMRAINHINILLSPPKPNMNSLAAPSPTSLHPSLHPVQFITSLTKALFEYMSADPKCWKSKIGERRRFGFAGVQQLILDIHFFLRICEGVVSDEGVSLANEVCERALRTYFEGSEAGGIKAGLKGGDWYDKRVDDVMAMVGSEFPELLRVRPAA
ncbi:exocyst complex component exo84 [Gaertneriomyces sp. JEL0708]|nr:exocyst complex component exo84 [Gaertneriomyces sp. JEL0708]